MSLYFVCVYMCVLLSLYIFSGRKAGDIMKENAEVFISNFFCQNWGNEISGALGIFLTPSLKFWYLWHLLFIWRNAPKKSRTANVNKQSNKRGRDWEQKRHCFCMRWITGCNEKFCKYTHASGRGPDTSLAWDKWSCQALTGSQSHQSKQALEFRAIISTGKALAGSQNKLSSGGLPGSQLTKIYSGRMQSAELGVRRSSGLQTWASATALRPTSGGAVTISVRPF